MKFEFNRKPKKLEIEADSYSAAISQAGDDYHLQKIDGQVVIGFCGKSGEPIKNEDPYFTSSDGKMYHSRCISV